MTAFNVTLSKPCLLCPCKYFLILSSSSNLEIQMRFFNAGENIFDFKVQGKDQQAKRNTQ